MRHEIPYDWFDYQTFEITDKGRKALEKLSFKSSNLIDYSMGLSTCEFCGATYAGRQEYCDLVIFKTHARTEGAWFDQVFYGYHMPKTTFTHNRDTYVSRSLTEERCGHQTPWNLEEKFNVQQAAIAVIANISNGLANKNDMKNFFSFSISRFSEQQVYLMSLALLHLQEENVDLQIQIRVLQQNIEAIVKHMNAAGDCLQL